MQVITMNRCYQVAVTPTVSTTPAYSANDQVGALQTITIPSGVTFTSIQIPQIHVIDSSKQSAALVFYFFSSAPTVSSADNAAVNISAADMAAKCICTVTVAAASYVTTTNATVGTNGDNNTGPYIVPSSPSSLYVLAQTTGTPTYATTSALTFQYVFVLNN